LTYQAQRHIYNSNIPIQMAPRTGPSPPPPSHNSYDDDIDIDEEPDSFPDCPSSKHLAAPSKRQDITGSSRTARANSTRRNVFSILGQLNVSPKVFSSTTIQTAALIAVYTICITTLWFIFCASYILTFYDDTKKLVRTSRVWARVKHGVRERLSMMGEDWEGLAKKYFDHPWTEFNSNTDAANKSAHLNDQQRNSNSGSTKTPQKEWEEWMKTMMYKFVSGVAGQETSNKFYQNGGARFRPSAQAGGSNDGRR